MTSTSRAAIVFVLIALFAGGTGTALYLREKDDAAAKDDSATHDAAVDAHASARAAKAKPPGKKKPRGGKTQVASRGAGGARPPSHPSTPNTPTTPAANHEVTDHGTTTSPTTGGAHHARSHAPPSGPTYESALDSNHQHVTIGGNTGPDLTDAQLSGPMSDGSFIGDCGAPDDMGVTVKVAIKMGRAVGVSVTTHPPSSDVAGCVDRHVRGLSWPSSPKLDSFVTTY